MSFKKLLKVLFVSVMFALPLVSCNMDTGKKDIDTVKNTMIDNKYRIGEAVNNLVGFKGNIHWGSFQPEGFKENIACIEADLENPDKGENIKTAKIQFLLNRSTGHVEIAALQVNDIPQPKYYAKMVLEEGHLVQGNPYSIITESPENLSETHNPAIRHDPTDETVRVKEPQVNVINKIVSLDHEYYKRNTTYSSTIQAAETDINGDGIADIIFTDNGRSGSCGYSYSALLGAKDGSYKLLDRYIECAALYVTLKKSMVNGFRVVYSGGDIFTFDDKNKMFVAKQNNR